MDPTHNEIMLDLETLDNKPTSAIVAIGAAAFNFDSDEMDTFYVNVAKWSSIAAGCTVDQGTLDWWARQGEAARAVLDAEDAIPLKDALKLFSDWVVKIRKGAHAMELGIWGNDNTFDLTISEHAFRVCNLPCPWNYWESRSVRTLVNIGDRMGINPKKDIPHEGVHHNAVDDSIHQVKYCKAIMAHIKGDQIGE